MVMGIRGSQMCGHHSLFDLKNLIMSSFIDKLTKKLENRNVGTLADAPESMDKNGVYAPTGCPELDWNIGIFGFPVGISQVSGPSKTGKTTLVLTALNNFLQQDEEAIAIWLACEERVNKKYMEGIVKHSKRMHIVRSKFLDDLFYEAQDIINDIYTSWEEAKMKGRPKIFIGWDSVGSTIAKAEMTTFEENVKTHKSNTEKGNNKEMKHAKMADFAKSAKMFMKAMLGQLYEKHIVFVFLNHVIDDLTTGNKTTPGGSWQNYMPCLHLTLKHKEWIRIDDEEVGQRTIVKVEKNDFGSRRKTEIEILVGVGIVLSEADIQYAIGKGILKQETKTVISFLNGKMKWRSTRTFYDLYREKNKLLPILHKKITQARHQDIINGKMKINETEEE